MTHLICPILLQDQPGTEYLKEQETFAKMKEDFRKSRRAGRIYALLGRLRANDLPKQPDQKRKGPQ